jgi:hypothetical protein
MPESTVAVVDAFGASYGYTEAFARAGFGVIQVHSTTEPQFGVEPVDPSNFRHTLSFAGDIDALAEILAGFRPLAVLPGRETGVELADALSEILQLSSNGTALSSARRDKYVQIERIKDQGVPGASQIRTNDPDELHAWHETLGGRAVIKPLRSYWGDGVSFCDSPHESVTALNRLRQNGTVSGEPITHIVAQEYLAGTEYIVNTVSSSGVHHVTDAWRTERITANGIRDLVVAQVLLRADEEPLRELTAYGFQVLDALGIRYGAAHLEIKLTPNGPRLVEAGARVSGLPYYVADILGEGQLEWTVNAYVRPELFHARAGDKYQRRRAFAWAALVSPYAGRLVRYRALDQVRTLESFRDMTMITKPGERIVRTTYDRSYPITLTLEHSVDAVLQRDLNTLRFLDGFGMYEVTDKD